MGNRLNAYTLSVLLAALFSGTMMLKGLVNHRSASVGWFTALMAQMFVWSGAYFFELTGYSFSNVLFWSKVEYLGAPFIAPTWISLVLTYTGKLGKIKPSKFFLFFFIPSLSALAAWTNSFHHLIWIHPSLLKEELFVTLNFSPGLWYFINFAYSYGLLIIAVIILLHSYLNTSPVFRWQILLLLSFSIINWVGNIFYIMKILPEHFDISPLILSISIIPLFYAVFKNSFFSVTPIAREILMDSITDPFIILDRFKQIMDFNREALAFSVSTIGDIRGNPADAVFPSIFNSRIMRALDKLQGSECELTVEHGQDLSREYYRIRITPLLEKNKYAAGYVLTMSNITELRTYAQKLEQKNKELEAFSRMVSHDIKNPLTAILGFSNILTAKGQEIPESERRTMIRDIHQNGEKIDSIIREIFLLSEVDITKNITFEPVSMGVIIKTVLDRLSALLADRNATVLKPDGWTAVHSYAPWIEQIWINYISNAVKYGGIPPVIKLQEEILGEKIRYLVLDNGKGLTAEQKGKLFNPFVRLEKGKEEGNGLGLSIVKRIVEKLGGETGITDNPEGGSIFYFTLPL